MAMVLLADGTSKVLETAGAVPVLPEMQQVVGGDVEMIFCHKGTALAIRQDGPAGLRFNAQATKHAREGQALFTGDSIKGDVVLLSAAEVDTMMNLDEVW